MKHETKHQHHFITLYRETHFLDTPEQINTKSLQKQAKWALSIPHLCSMMKSVIYTSSHPNTMIIVAVVLALLLTLVCSYFTH